ncbi:AAA family ATPase [Streptomyces sp. APSN-46.1]|uniref:RNA ligase family protein n=1 Tax=Streptomyces sp. APSN-46.1 TaxID=2929049 RepID=UPI001FB3E3F1|nr:RNA ligase family protein [Streptomyces sp. APSN-46.1]MCJ1676729.1 AAA family ATPase [Streptomyces sp. APSN-46.1]
MRTHYPRTPHLPWSPGVGGDDVRAAAGLAGLAGREVVVTEKLDGENTTLYSDGLHARSLDSGHHPSRAWVKGLQGRIGPGIPAGWRVCGENLYARHSIPYEDLDSWFYGFSVWDGEQCLDWDRTVRFLHGLGVPGPRVLWRGTFDERVLRGLRLDTARQEGYVVRTAAGFARADFGRCVAKWVRGGHVQTDTHWMYARVVPNGLGPRAPLWAVRSGADPEVAELLGAVGFEPAEAAAEGGAGAGGRADEMVGQVAADMGGLGVGRTGEARLAGVLAAALHRVPRSRIAARLAAGPAGMPLARRVADLVGLYPSLRRPFPDEERRAGLVRMAVAADLGVLHALAGATADPEERECAGWSALYAEEAGLLGAAPLEPLRAGLREALTGLGGTGTDGGTDGDAGTHSDAGAGADADAGAGIDADVADRCWAEAREAFARGRISTAEEAVAATWRWRDGAYPRMVQLCGPSGSGKSTFARNLPGVDAYISLDDLRAARGSRADQRANAEVLREGLDRLDKALAAGGTVLWDATSLTERQRGLAGSVARRRDALVTQAVVLVDEAELWRRNATRAHPVPPQVLTAQLHRFSPPYPGQGQAHRTWYIGAGGTVEDTAGGIRGRGEDG